MTNHTFLKQLLRMNIQGQTFFCVTLQYFHFFDNVNCSFVEYISLFTDLK